MHEAGIAYDPDMVVWFHTEDRKTKPGMIMELLLKQKKEIDGNVCYNDQNALEVIYCLKKNGVQVPTDISVTGYDNSVIG